MFTISTMMTTAFRCFFAITQPSVAKPAVPSSSPSPMIVDAANDSKSSGPALQKKQVAKRTLEEDDEQPRKQRKTQHDVSQLAGHAPNVEELTNAFGKLKISDNTKTASVEDLTSAFRRLTLSAVEEDLANAFGKLKISDHTDTASIQDLMSAFHKLTLSAVDDDLARSFAGLVVLTDDGKGKDDAVSEKASVEDHMDIDSGCVMDLDDDHDDDKTDGDDHDDDMDVDLGHMMDIDMDDDETKRMDAAKQNEASDTTSALCAKNSPGSHATDMAGQATRTKEQSNVAFSVTPGSCAQRSRGE